MVQILRVPEVEGRRRVTLEIGECSRATGSPPARWVSMTG
jgi:hypothetical protein